MSNWPSMPSDARRARILRICQSRAWLPSHTMTYFQGHCDCARVFHIANNSIKGRATSYDASSIRHVPSLRSVDKFDLLSQRADEDEFSQAFGAHRGRCARSQNRYDRDAARAGLTEPTPRSSSNVLKHDSLELGDFIISQRKTSRYN